MAGDGSDVVNVYQLRDARLLVLGDAVHKWHLLVTALESAIAEAQQNVASRLRGSQWVGADADGAYRNLDRLEDDLRHASQQARLVFAAIDNASHVFDKGQRDLGPLLDSAAGKFFVTESGDVLFQEQTLSPGASSQLVETISAENSRLRAEADTLRSAISAVMKPVVEADAQLAGALNRLTVTAGSDTTLASWQDTQADSAAMVGVLGNGVDLAAIPKGNPQAAAAWWAGLTDGQREEFIALAPQSVGQTDGLPSAVRDQANRIALKEKKAEIQPLLDPAYKKAMEKMTSPISGPEALDEWLKLQSQMDGITALESKLDSQVANVENPYRQQIPPAYLLGFDTAGNGRAIVAIGNPDTAQNIATYVPGTGATLKNTPGLIERAQMIQSAATKEAPGQTTSTVMWLGYDAPQNPVTESSRTIFADHGAPHLTQFVNGLDAAHQGPPAHTTLISHSYAGLVAGRALERDGLVVGDAVFVGSVGTGPEHASDLHMPPEHVWAGTAANDAVPDWAIPVNPTKWLDDSSVRFGADPTSQKFGARVFDVDPGPTQDWAPDFDAHSDYWDYNSRSLQAMGRITTGQQP
jgi:pimeloyl-ACP methyl ester carboxylesterase